MILDIIYNLFITPIEMIIEFIFSIINRIAENPGIAIIGVSLVVNFLVLPLYKKSDDLSEAERDKQKEMKPWLDHIKKTFKGDERYMMTQEYYRTQGYKPIYALRSSLSLLLQIPFFIAAYHYLSNLSILQDASFLCFANLGQPDGLLQIGSLSINILPILMTLINVVSAFIYLRGFPIRDKIQTYGIAAIFLVLLYNSPSGLVFYWTLNQIFSVCKNIVMKLLPKREKRVRKQPELIDKKLFFIGTIAMALFAGFIIPLSIMSSSPTEFMSTNYGPVGLAVNTLSIYVGLFIVWFSIFYYLCTNRGKNIFTYAVWIILGISIINFYFFGKNYGSMSPSLIYDVYPEASMKYMLANIAVTILVGFVFFFLLKKFRKVARAIGTILIIACIGLSAMNIIRIQGEVTEAEKRIAASGNNTDPIIPLSKDGKNVIVFMLDRALAEFAPTIIEELNLQSQYEGFTYYPNTVSFGKFTNFCTPSLFGGYDYTPVEINKRDTESLRDKQNEALKVLPKLFNDKDYQVTVCDPPYAGDYSWIPDVSIYDGEEYKNTKAYVTTGAYKYDDPEYVKHYEVVQQRNFACYSIFRCVPTVAQIKFYDSGNYYSTTKALPFSKSFIESYAVMDKLSDLTYTCDSGNTFLMMQNSITHEVSDLSAGDYVPKVNDETLSINASEIDKHYDVNAAGLKLMAKWFDFLKAEGVWDNTRIIICSDHGSGIEAKPELIFKGIDVEAYNPLLMVKDFNSKEFRTSDEFMTIGDIATLATDGVIENAINPFTGNPINSDAKEKDVMITTSHLWDTYTNNGNVFDTSDAPWFKLTGKNIFVPESWEEIK